MWELAGMTNAGYVITLFSLSRGGESITKWTMTKYAQPVPLARLNCSV